MSRRERVSDRWFVARMLDEVGRHVAKSDENWLQARLSMLPLYWSRHVEAEHARRGGLSCADANRWLLALTDGAGGRLPLAIGDDALRRLARSMARDCVAIAGGSGGAVYERMAGFCRRLEVVPPEPKAGGDYMPCIRRMMCSRWWLRALRRAAARRCEARAIRDGVVRRGLWPYISQDQLSRREAQKRRNVAAVGEASIVDLDNGDEVALAAVVDGSLANPSNRRAEMMVRIRGADEMALDSGHRCEFWTLTAPSKFHAQRVTGACAENNPAYQGATPKQAQQHLSAVWARARAAWKRRGLVVYGLRTAEPHHDGCPHWHIVVYGPARDLRFARRLLRVYALRVDGGEAGAARHRLAVLPLQGGGEGASYAAKYIAKNIDGGPIGAERDSEKGRKISDTAKRVDAWASAWGIRQFQFFGMPAVGVWRVLRRFSEAIGPVDSGLEAARKAADEADWCAFWRAMRGASVVLIRDVSVRLTEYGDRAVAPVVAVCEGGRRAEVVRGRWGLAWSKKAAAALASEARRGSSWVAVGLGFDLPWSGVNNCTGAQRRGFAGGALIGCAGRGKVAL